MHNGSKNGLSRNNSVGAERVAALKRVPQARQSLCELISYALLPFIFIMTGAMPSASLFLLPVILCMLFLLYRRFGPYFPLSCIFGYGAVTLSVNYDILSVVFFVALIFAFCGLVFSAQISPYLACAALAAVSAVVGALVGVGIVRLAEDKPVKDIAHDYVMAERYDPVIGFLARDYYDGVKLPADMDKLKPTDEGYDLAAAESFAEWAGDEFELYFWYYCLHYGAVFAAVAFFMSVAIGQRTSSCYDVGASPDRLRGSTRALGGIRAMPTPVSEMRMPRSYLWTCVLPATVAGIVLEFVGGYDALSATIMHAFATLPSAFCFFTLLVFFASLFKGKARIIAHIALYVIGVAMVVFPVALFIGSMIGVCDCILNLRYWTRFIMED